MPFISLGPGYLESVYEEAMCVEMTFRQLPFLRQHRFALEYRGRPVGEGRLDFLVSNLVVVELKAVDQLHPIHEAQALSYLRATQLRLALLINFNVPVLKDGIRRMVL